MVSDGYWNSRLVWFDEDGNYLKEVGGLGGAPGQLALPHTLTLDPAGRLIVGNVCGTALHPYVTAPGQIAPERQQPIPGCVSRFEVFTREGEYVGPWDGVPEPGLPLSIATYGDRIYAGVAGSQRGRQDLVVVDAETEDEVFRIPNANVYVHQMAMAPNGDIYVASVYPEHGGEPRGIEGPSFVRWASDRYADGGTTGGAVGVREAPRRPRLARGARQRRVPGRPALRGELDQQ